MAILFADLYIVILSAYWNTIHRSGCIEISSANLHICIYIELLSSNLQIEILSQQHIYAAEKCNFQFATKEKKKCDPVSKQTVKPKKIHVEFYQFSVFFQSLFSLISRVNLKRFKPRRVEIITLAFACLAFPTMFEGMMIWFQTNMMMLFLSQRQYHRALVELAMNKGKDPSFIQPLHCHSTRIPGTFTKYKTQIEPKVSDYQMGKR